MADIENPGGGGGGVVVDARPDPDRRCAPLLCMLGALIAFCILSMLFYRAHWAAGLGGGCGPAHPGGHGPWDSSSLACCCVFVVVEGFTNYRPFWEHCLEYRRESIACPNRILFLKYEDMMSEPVKYVIRLATFLGVPFSNKEEEDGIPEEVVRLCSFDKLSSLDTNQTGDLIRRGNLIVEKSAFIRKGKVGDWVNHMSQEMGRKLDWIVEEKLKGTGLVL
nr:flavonol sulfotransferase-like [Setaria viridis]